MPKAQILSLDPNTELTFKGPFTEYVTSNLQLTNPTEQAVFFKVKTTAPRYYCVRPNSGVVKPSETATINVTLQPVESMANLESERARHKFMIQTAYAPDEEMAVDAFWKSVDSADVIDSKLRVVFLRASGEPIDAPVKDVGPGGAAPQSSPSLGSANLQSAAQSPPSSTAPSEAGGINGGGGHPSRDHDHSLQKEVELRKMYQDEKNKLEHENYALLEKLDKLARSAGNVNVEGLPLLHVILVAILALLIGIIFGKIIF